MLKYDIYDQQLFPGDHICCVVYGQIHIALIKYISCKGTLFIAKWNDELQIFSNTLKMFKGYNIIKLTDKSVYKFNRITNEKVDDISQ